MHSTPPRAQQQKAFPAFTPSESVKRKLLAGLAPALSPTPSRTLHSTTKQTGIDDRGATTKQHLSPYGTSTKSTLAKTTTTKTTAIPDLLTPPDSPTKSVPAKLASPSTWSIKDTDEGPLTVLVDSPKLEAYTTDKGWTWPMSYELARQIHAGLADSRIPLQSLAKLSIKKNEISLQKIHALLKGNPDLHSTVHPPHSNVDTELEKEGMESANMRGVLHYYGSLKLDGKKLMVDLRPVEVGPGNRFFRQYGSDRFFRLKIPQELSQSFEKDSTSSSSDFSTFLDSPLLLFGRIYRPFCFKKEGSLYYFCESGKGIPTITLETFCESHIQASLNGNMSVSKYRSRFELGLTPTTPTIGVSYFIRIPDLMNDSLKISYGAMKYVYQELLADGATFQGAPAEYVPSCIEGSYTLALSTGTRTYPMIWYLNFATVNNASDPSVFQCRPGENGERPQSVKFSFWIKNMNGALQKTAKTISKASEIEWVDDGKRVEKREIMTDGCSLVTQKAMQGIYEHLLDAGVAEQESRPCAAQARCGPAKGVWSEAPWSPWSHHAILEARDSQTKYNDTVNRSKKPYFFEVHSIPHSKSSAKLNVQYLSVLAHCGVSNEAFVELLRDNYGAQKSLFFDNFDDITQLLHILETRTPLCALRDLRMQSIHHPTLMKIDDEKADNEMTEDDVGAKMFIEERFAELGRDPSSATPNSIYEVAFDCLRQGMPPRHSYILANTIRKIAKLSIESTLLKSNIELDNARNVLVIADHLGVLGEGEVFYQSKRPIATSVDGIETSILTGPVLVGRAPARLPSDFQKVTAVYREQFASFKEVLILSSKGAQSLCSLLSGGDYDGDRLIVIAEKTLVNAFQPEKADSSYAIPPFVVDHYFDIDTATVAKSVTPLITKRERDELSKELIRNLYTVRRFARLSEYFQRLEYCFGLDDEDSVLVAHLFNIDLDGSKQGMVFNEEAWEALSKRILKRVPHQPKHVMITKVANLSYEPVTGNFIARRLNTSNHLMDELQEESRHLMESFRKFSSEFLNQFNTFIDPDFEMKFAEEYQEAVDYEDRQLLVDLVTMIKHVQENYSDKFVRERTKWAKSREKQGNGQSPHKSPEKRKGWRTSSPSMKQAMLGITADFWSLLDQNVFRSSAFRGKSGASRARRCMASIAYLVPQVPHSFVTIIDAVESSRPSMPKFSSKGSYSSSFAEKSAKTKQGYAYDVALRDLLTLKADANTNRDYARLSMGTSRGLGAPPSYQPVLDTMVVKKRRLGGVIENSKAGQFKKAKTS